MIYTLTLNPCLDYVVKTEKLNIGATNRSSGEEIYPGGKGINVSVVLKNLGCKNKALGFAGGFTGEKIVDEISKMGVDSDFIMLQSGNSRINVKIKAEKETEINASGPEISETDFCILLEKLSTLKKGDILVLTGNISAGMKDDSYARILDWVKGLGVIAVVDASGNLLKNTLKYKPFLIKPNIDELEGIFATEITETEIENYARKLQEMGAKNVLVSLGEGGAVLLDEKGKVYTCKAPEGTLVNSVGAGDSMVAGFLCEYSKTKDYKEALKTAVAAGSATAFKPYLAEKDDIENIKKEITV